ncbi:uroporphyrinogen decarboxylase family protein [Ruminococcus sp. 5_1_39BFAA]|uniref:uroporphyrinogen decarboxylase family protein n=1 Tax=Ruminococcus sp. 5_1_39BFAA TaxID=457412 RepID=UPI00356B4440
MEHSTDHKNIDLYDFQLDVINKRAQGRILWQPRIGCWFEDKEFAKEELPGVFKGMSLVEVYKELGCSNRIYEYNDCFQAVDDSSIVRKEIKHSELETEYIIETPVGAINCIIMGNTSNSGTFPKKWWVEDEDDLSVMSYVLAHQTWVWREDIYQKIYEKWGRIGAPAIFMPRVNIQYLYLDIMGVENAVYMLSDYQEEVEAFFEVLEKNQEQMIEVINQSPIQMIDFGDNLHCGMLPPCYVEEYIIPAYQRRCDLLHKAGKFVYSHWDGNTKTILKYARQTGLDGIEAITPKPQGDVTLKEVKEALGDMWLIDGIAAILFDERYTVEELKEQVKECIELFAPNLILGISDELSSTGDIERVRMVGEMVDEYNRNII